MRYRSSELSYFLHSRDSDDVRELLVTVACRPQANNHTRRNDTRTKLLLSDTLTVALTVTPSLFSSLPSKSGGVYTARSSEREKMTVYLVIEECLQHNITGCPNDAWNQQ